VHGTHYGKLFGIDTSGSNQICQPPVRLSQNIVSVTPRGDCILYVGHCCLGLEMIIGSGVYTELLCTTIRLVAAIDDPLRIRRSRDIGTYLGLVPRRHQSGEVDYVGSISKCGDRRVRTLLYEAPNVMLTRYKGQLKLKDWAFAIAKRSTMRKARVALARRLAIIMHAMLRDGTEFAWA
jgi:transposase